MNKRNFKKSTLCLLLTLCFSLSFLLTMENSVFAILVNDTNNEKFNNQYTRNTYGETKVEPTSIEVETKSKELLEGQSFNLNVNVAPENANTSDDIKYESSDTNVVKVTNDGVVIAQDINSSQMIKDDKSYKTATVTASTKNGSKSTCDVKVLVKVDKITVSSSIKDTSGTLVLKTNKSNEKSTRLKINVYPSNAHNKNIKVDYDKKNFSIKKESNSSYLITALSAKKAYSTNFAVSSVATPSVKASKKITAHKVGTSVKVKNKKKIKAKVRKHNINTGRTISLKANIKPTSATSKSIIWKSSNNKIATVNSKGVVKGKKPGKVKITAYVKYNPSVKKSYTITVHKQQKIVWPVGKKAGKVRYNVESLYGKRGGKTHGGIDIIVGVKPVYAASKGKVVKVSSNGGWGKYVIVKHPNGSKTLYSHLNTIKVKKGKKVTTSTCIGKSGSTGRVTTSHLHFEIIDKKGKRYSAIKSSYSGTNHNPPYKKIKTKTGCKYVWDKDFIWK